MKLKYVLVGLDQESLEWLERAGNKSAKIRSLIHEKIDQERGIHAMAIAFRGRPRKHDYIEF